MKKLENLTGAKALNKNEQKSINGGGQTFCCLFPQHCEPDNHRPCNAL